MTMRALCWQLLLVLFSLGLFDPAEAQTYVAQFPPNPGVLPGGGWQYTAGTTFGDPPGPRAWVNGKYGGIPQFKATDQYRLNGPVGALTGVAVVSTAGLAGAAAAVGRCVIGLNPVCALGTAAYLAIEKYRAIPPVDGQMVCGGVPCSFPSGQFDYDPGQDPTSGNQTRYCWAVSGCYTGTGTNQAAPWSATALDAANLGVAYQNAQAPLNPANETCANVSYTYSPTFSLKTAPSLIGGTYTILRTTNLPATPCRPGGATVFADVNGTIAQLANVNVSACPASVDASNPAYSIPAGSPVGPDGKCPTARYNHVPRTPEQIADIINSFPPNLPDAGWGKGVSDAIDLGGQQAPASLTGSGPASQTGTPTTTTTNNPDGTTGKNTNTPTTTYTYNNTSNSYPKITYTTINNYTTQTCTGGGSCTTTGGGSTPGPSSSDPKQDPEDPCVKDPTRLSCMKVGEAGPKETIPTENVPATYTPTVFAAPGGCPAAIPFSVFGKSFSLGYDPMCNTLATIRLIFLAVGAVAAAWMFQEGVFKL